jgi:hypothetical protein
MSSLYKIDAAMQLGHLLFAWLFVLLFVLINVAQILFDLLFHESWVIRATDRRRALAKAMQEKLNESNNAAGVVPDNEQNGRRSLDLEEMHAREHHGSRYSLDIPRRPMEV